MAGIVDADGGQDMLKPDFQEITEEFWNELGRSRRKYILCWLKNLPEPIPEMRNFDSSGRAFRLLEFYSGLYDISLEELVRKVLLFELKNVYEEYENDEPALKELQEKLFKDKIDTAREILKQEGML